MTTLLNLFYQLPLEFIAQCFLLASLAFLCVFQRFEHHRRLRCGMWVTLILWFVAALWITTFSRSPGPAHPVELVPFHSYRELHATGTREIIRTNFMNVALFYPAGLLTASLVPDHRPHWQKLLFAGIVFALFSLLIEYLQFTYALGEPEIDDVIHNLFGAILGMLPIIFRNILHDPET